MRRLLLHYVRILLWTSFLAWSLAMFFLGVWVHHTYFEEAEWELIAEDEYEETCTFI